MSRFHHRHLLAPLSATLMVLSAGAIAAPPGAPGSTLAMRVRALEAQVTALRDDVDTNSDWLTSVEDSLDDLGECVLDVEELTPASWDAQALLAYRLDEGSGGLAFDSSGHGPTGSIVTAGWSSSGYSGAALDFDGTNQDHVEVAPGLTLGDTISVEAWIYVDGNTGDHQVIVAQWYDNNSNDQSFVLELTPSLQPQFYLHGLATATGGTLSIGEWHHVAGTYDGDTVRLYVDGAEDDTASAPGAITDSSAPVLVGAHDHTSDHNSFFGLIDEVRIFGRPLTEDEVAGRM